MPIGTTAGPPRWRGRACAPSSRHLGDDHGCKRVSKYVKRERNCLRGWLL